MSGNKWKGTHIVQNLWDTTMAVLRGNSITTQAYLKKIETFQTTDITPHLQGLEEKQQTKPRASRRKELIKIGAELNYIATKRTIQQINKFRILVL